MNFNDVPDSKCSPMADVAYSTINGLKHGYLCAMEVIERGIEGAFVECGVANGSQIGMMNRACQDVRYLCHFHLFDSFEGIPLGCEKDTQQPGIGDPLHDQSAPLEDRLVSSGVTVCSEDSVRANMDRFGVRHFTIHKGWFQHTLPALKDFPPIALLRLDGDMYESTMCCLEHLYPLVVPGGMIIIDDWGLAGCQAAVKEYLAAHELTPEITIEDVGYPIARWTK